ncbi:MAG: hypothetical protein IKP73_02870 [Bacteroidales bacterium]|nr:hypothetical protein [Bacteroidales bacterium]
MKTLNDVNMVTNGISIAIKNYIFVVLFAALFCVETNAQTYLQTEKGSADLEYEDGVEWAVQRKDGFVVAASLSFTKEYGKYYKVDLFVKNLNSDDVVFNPEKIKSRLYMQGRYGLDTIALKVYTCEQYMKKVRRQQNLAMALYGVAAGLNAASAAYSESTSYTYGSNGTTYITETYNYDAGAAALANIQSTNEIISLSRMMNDEQNVKKQGYLKINTLRFGEAVSGYVNVDRFCRADFFSVRIEVNDSKFYFEWIVKDWRKIAREKRRAERYDRYDEQDDDY